jgi:hypothetical protein
LFHIFVHGQVPHLFVHSFVHIFVHW